MSTHRYVKGAQEVQAELLAYPAKVEQKVTRNSMAAGARLVRDAARAEVPVRSGKLRGTIRVATRAKKDGVTTAGIRVGDRKKGIFWRHFVLGGTKPHVIVAKRGKGLKVGNLQVSRVQHPGAKPNNFIERAKGAIPRALDAIVEHARVLIDKLNKEVMGK